MAQPPDHSQTSLLDAHRADTVIVRVGLVAVIMLVMGLLIVLLLDDDEPTLQSSATAAAAAANPANSVSTDEQAAAVAADRTTTSDAVGSAQSSAPLSVSSSGTSSATSSDVSSATAGVDDTATAPSDDPAGNGTASTPTTMSGSSPTSRAPSPTTGRSSGGRLATPAVALGPDPVTVGGSLWASWSPDPATGSYTYRTTLDGATVSSDRVDGMVGQVGGVALTASGPGRFCVVVAAVAVPGVVQPGTIDSVGSAPACVTVSGPSGSDPAPLAAPTVSSGPGAGEAGVEFSWAPVPDPDVYTYTVTITYEGTTIAAPSGLPNPGAYHSFANGGAPGEYCGVVQAFPRPGVNRAPSALSQPLCYTKVS